MRMRVVQPAFWDSPALGVLSWDARLVFAGMWSYVRDEGVGIDSVGLIAGALFAFDTEQDYEATARRIGAALDELCAAELLIRFALKGVKYIEVANWADWQKPDHPGKVRFPTSAEVQELSQGSSRESSRNTSRSDVDVDAESESESESELGDGCKEEPPPLRNTFSPESREAPEASRKRAAGPDKSSSSHCRLCNGDGWELDGEGTPVEPARKCACRRKYEGRQEKDQLPVLDVETVEDHLGAVFDQAAERAGVP